MEKEEEHSEDVKAEVQRATWSFRPCDAYKAEYKECKRPQSRFHQYFIYGETTDCTPWYEDYENCLKYENKGDLKAARTLIESEKKRRMERFRGHYQNDVWEKRDSPPEDWNKPLPEIFQEQYKDSYLYHAQRELEGIAMMPNEKKESFCTIM